MRADLNEKLLADIDAKVVELKTAIREANTALKDTRAERKELKAHLAWALEEHQKLLTEMVEKSSAEVLRATGEALDAVTRHLHDIVARTQSVQTLGRVERLLRFVATQIIDDPDARPGGGTSAGTDSEGSTP